MIRVASPIPSSIPVCAGATRFTHRYTAGSRSEGFVSKMARNAATRWATISSRFAVSAMACIVMPGSDKSGGVSGAGGDPEEAIVPQMNAYGQSPRKEQTS